MQYYVVKYVSKAIALEEETNMDEQKIKASELKGIVEHFYSIKGKNGIGVKM